MAKTGFFHHIGTFLLFVSVGIIPELSRLFRTCADSKEVLLVVTDISSPVVNTLAILRVNLGNQTSQHHTALTFGTFGYCTIDTLNSG